MSSSMRTQPRAIRSLAPQSTKHAAGIKSPIKPSDRVIKKLKTVTQACEDCRKSKSKCDGARPRCGTCLSKDRPCGYQGHAGQSRQAAMKGRLDKLERLFYTLQNKPPEDAERLLQRIRSADGVGPMLNGGWEDDIDESSPATALSASPFSGQESQRSPLLSSWPTDTISDSQHDELVAMDASTTRSTYASSLSGLSTTSPGGRTQPANTSTLVIPMTMPNFSLNPSLTRAAVDGFYADTGQLFHVFSQAQAEGFLQEIFGSESQRLHTRSHANVKKAVCCVACIAAVGAQYNAEVFGPSVADFFYTVARHYFVDAFEDCPLDAIKVCSLLAMFNIQYKATVSVAYLEYGLTMSRRHGLHDRDHVYPGLTQEEWAHCRLTLRVLIFFSSWLCSTIGYISDEDVPVKDILPHVRAELENSDDIVDIVQDEMTKISLLQADILRKRLTLRDLTGFDVESIMHDLQEWYSNLPDAMLLASLAQSDLDDSTRRSIYYVHLLYLGAVILLYRRVACQLIKSVGVENEPQSGRPLREPLEQLMLDHAEQGVVAAKTSSRVLGLLLRETGCFKRCWVVIFQSYTSCLVLLHCIAQKQAHGMHPSTWEEEVPQAQTCLDTLEFCGSRDPVALQFHDRLQLVFDRLKRNTALETPALSSLPGRSLVHSSSSPSSPSSSCLSSSYSSSSYASSSSLVTDAPPSHPAAYLLTSPSRGDPDAINLAASLLRTLSRPYDPADEEKDQRPAISRPKMDGTWDVNQAKSTMWGQSELCIPKEFAKEAEFKEVRFLGSLKPSGWS